MKSGNNCSYILKELSDRSRPPTKRLHIQRQQACYTSVLLHSCQVGAFAELAADSTPASTHNKMARRNTPILLFRDTSRPYNIYKRPFAPAGITVEPHKCNTLYQYSANATMRPDRRSPRRKRPKASKPCLNALRTLVWALGVYTPEVTVWTMIAITSSAHLFR